MARRSRLVRPSVDEPVGGGVEVVEHVLLVAAAAGVVPRLALLEPAAQPGDGVQPAGRAPRGDLRRPDRRLGDGEPAVAVEDRRRVGPGRDVGAVDRGTARSSVPSSDGYVDLADGEAAGQRARRRRSPPHGVAGRRPPTRHSAVGASNESTTANASPVSRSAASAGDGDRRRRAPSTDAERACRRRRSGGRCRRRRRWSTTQQPVAARRRRCESTASPSATSVVPRVGAAGGIGVERRPARRGPVARRASVTPTSDVAVGGELRTASWPRRRRSPSSTRPVARSSRWTSTRPSRRARGRAASGRRATASTSRPRLRVGVLGPHDRVVAPVGAEAVVVDGAVVLVALGVAGVEKPEPSGSQATLHARVSGIASPTIAAVAVGVETRAARSPRCRPRSCRRRRARRRATARTSRSAFAASARADAPGRASTTGARVGIDGRAPGEHELLGAGRALEAEQVVAADLACHARRAAASARRGARATRPGRAGRRAPDGCSAFWAATHGGTSGASPSSSQR